jgi:hypothetical protein
MARKPWTSTISGRKPCAFTIRGKKTLGRYLQREEKTLSHITNESHVLKGSPVFS